jgi:hypothetical protein
VKKGDLNFLTLSQRTSLGNITPDTPTSCLHVAAFLSRLLHFSTQLILVTLYDLVDRRLAFTLLPYRNILRGADLWFPYRRSRCNSGLYLRGGSFLVALSLALISTILTSIPVLPQGRSCFSHPLLRCRSAVRNRASPAFITNSAQETQRLSGSLSFCSTPPPRLLYFHSPILLS